MRIRPLAATLAVALAASLAGAVVPADSPAAPAPAAAVCGLKNSSSSVGYLYVRLSTGSSRAVAPGRSAPCKVTQASTQVGRQACKLPNLNPCFSAWTKLGISWNYATVVVR